MITNMYLITSLRSFDNLDYIISHSSYFYTVHVDADMETKCCILTLSLRGYPPILVEQGFMGNISRVAKEYALFMVMAKFDDYVENKYQCLHYAGGLDPDIFLARSGIIRRVKEYIERYPNKSGEYVIEIL